MELLHSELSTFNRARLSPALPNDGWREDVTRELEMRVREGDFVEQERAKVRERASAAPLDPDAFVTWFEDLRASGPGQGDPLFPWLASTSSLAQMKWFLTQEVAGEAGFEDLVALAQIKLGNGPKLELARNYWDEMGRGNEAGMHGGMLANLAAELELKSDAAIVWESLALGNLMVAVAANRRYAYQAMGALGVIELTAPGRATLVTEGLKRLGVSARGRHYFALHATLDVKHSEAWNREILRPMVAASPPTATAIAEGALMRLEAGRRCFARYRSELGVSALPQVERAALPE